MDEGVAKIADSAAAALPDLGIVKHLALVGDEGGVEEVVRHAREVVAVERAVSQRRDHGVAVVLGHDEAFLHQGIGHGPVIHDPHRRAVRSEFGELGRFTAVGECLHIELHDVFLG